MILMLITPEEKEALDKDIMKEPILIYTQTEILSKLYGEVYDSILVTRRFANLAGSDNLVNAIKSLNLILPLGGLNVIYLNHHEAEDACSKDLYKIGCKVLKADIKSMTLDTFLDLKYTKSLNVKGVSEKEVVDDLLSIIHDIESMDDDALRLYVGVHYNKIVNSLLNAKGVVENLEGIRLDNKTLGVELQHALDAEATMSHELILTKYLYHDVKAKHDLLLKYLTAYKESIDNYNDIIAETTLGDEYTVKIPSTNCIVLYFKEIEDIGFLRFYNSLVNHLNNVKKYNTKSIIIESTNRTYYNPYKGYDVLSSLSTTSDVVQSDHILRYGNCSKIIGLLMRNQFMLQVMVILDRTGNDSLVLDSPNQLVYYLGKRRENFPTLNIQDENFISPCEGIWTDIEILLNKAETLKQIPFDIYANRHPLMTNIIKLVDEHVYTYFN